MKSRDRKSDVVQIRMCPLTFVIGLGGFPLCVRCPSDTRVEIRCGSSVRLASRISCLCSQYNLAVNPCGFACETWKERKNKRKFLHRTPELVIISRSLYVRKAHRPPFYPVLNLSRGRYANDWEEVAAFRRWESCGSWSDPHRS